MILITTSSTEKDLEGILELQKNNLSTGLSADEKKEQGFVTVVHNLDDLKKMQLYEPNIVAKADEKVIAYILAMTDKSKAAIPILVSMFDGFNHIKYQGKAIANYRYMVVGQVCVDKSFRGQGLFEKCYLAYKQQFGYFYDFAITEIATVNVRSMNAHKKVGFIEICKTKDSDGSEWSIVIWDWKK